MKQNRWKSKVLWVAIIAQIIAVLQLANVFQLIGIDAGLVGDIVAGVLQLLVLFGVLNSPSSKDSF